MTHARSGWTLGDASLSADTACSKVRRGRVAAVVVGTSTDVARGLPLAPRVVGLPGSVSLEYTR